jgi:hypothetical protein
LPKPFDQERFEKALKRAKDQLASEHGNALSERILRAIEDIKTKPVHLERLVIKLNGHVFFMKAEEIDWLEAEGNYVRLHSGKESYLLRDTITALESQLDPKRFIRVHRSAIVNVDRISELQPWFHGEYRIVLRAGVQLTLSRTYREKLHELLGRPCNSAHRLTLRSRDSVIPSQTPPASSQTYTSKKRSHLNSIHNERAIGRERAHVNAALESAESATEPARPIPDPVEAVYEALHEEDRSTHHCGCPAGRCWDTGS